MVDRPAHVVSNLMETYYGKELVMIRFFIVSATILVLSMAGCSTKPDWKDYQKGTHLVLEAQPGLGTTADRLMTTIDILKKRLHDFGVNDYLIQTEDNHRFVIQFPRQLEIDGDLRRLLLQPHRLEFKLVNDDLTERGEGVPLSQDHELLYSLPTPQMDRQPYVVEKKTLLTGETISDAEISFDPRTSSPNIAIRFNQQGASVFEAMTAKNIDRRLAIVLDRYVYSAPRIMGRIKGGRAILTGAFTDAEARMLAICLTHSPYPCNLKILAEKRITKETWLGKPMRPNT